MSVFNGTATILQEQSDSPYNYIPSRSVAIIFVVLFGISTVAHTGQAIYSRIWWLFPTICICGIVEVAGWSGRLWSSFNATNSDAFMLQICATILAPTPLLAANFVILGRIIRRLGTSYSRLPPRWYTIIFCTCDFVSLIIQGTGGGLAASADVDATPGANVMLGGIVFQLVTISVYSALAVEFFVRFIHDRPVDPKRNDSTATLLTSLKSPMTPKLKTMFIALAFSTVCLFIRAVYRTIELTDGWSGRIISTEIYFNVLDGAMIVLAIYTMNFVHPGIFLRDDEDPKVIEKRNIV
ncbi:Uncharacterized protein C17G6.02c [Hypsizygus marmoreus]|uniref:Uncharacterized protein C17G6.02c n=1 Tax=Hypsizygus marmoreus TaxID=39966 RepID=A0A369JB09_HYPMA|nr:Uncharacterized protein C17G6.02c [Hypsizygus marmoreus]